MHNLSTHYLEALLAGERRVASRLVLDAVDQGTSVKDIYINVFQRSQDEIGRLWFTNRVSVAQEHFCSAATQMIMSQLYPHIFATEKIGRRLVVACVGGELHEIGARMVADFCEMDGWDTYYLGANAPATSIVEAVETGEWTFQGLSATMPFHRKPLREIIARVRESRAVKGIKILVGGYALNPSLVYGSEWEPTGSLKMRCTPPLPPTVWLRSKLSNDAAGPRNRLCCTVCA